MRKIVLALCIFAATNIVWADDPPPFNVPHSIQAGFVKSVSWADPNKGTRSEIVVLDATKKAIHILITANTTLWDADAKAIMPDRIIARSHVNVIYFTTPEGINVGKSVKILK